MIAELARSDNPLLLPAVRTWQGWLDLAAVMDCYSRRIVAWTLRPDLEAGLVVDALETAIARPRPTAVLVHSLA